MPNPFAKIRKNGQPYAIYRLGGVTWHVLKTYKQPSSESKDPYARWFVAAKSAATFGGFDMGDTYAAEVQRDGALVAAEPAWLEAYGYKQEYLPTPAEYLAQA